MRLTAFITKHDQIIRNDVRKTVSQALVADVTPQVQ